MIFCLCDFMQKHVCAYICPWALSGQCVEKAITKHEYLTNKERGWEASMTTEENGHDIMKAFLNDQGESNDERPNFFATFESGDTQSTFEIIFQGDGVKYLKEFRGQFYTECEENTLRITFYSSTTVVKEDVCISLLV